MQERKKQRRNLSILKFIGKDVLELMLIPFVSLDSSLYYTAHHPGKKFS